MTIADTTPQPLFPAADQPQYVSAWEAADFLGGAFTPWNVSELCAAGVIASTTWPPGRDDAVLRVETGSLREYAERLPGFEKGKSL